MPDPIGAHYLDHCGVSVRTPESTIVFDPITPDLAADAVCVSHCHEDHFNPEVLSTFDRSTTIVVPRILKPRGKSSPNAVEKLVAFRPGGEADAKTYGALLSDALRELARLEGTQRGKSVAPELDRLGIYFAGLDVIGPYLTEVNVTSPTGVQETNRLSGTKLEAEVIDMVEAKCAGLSR